MCEYVLFYYCEKNERKFFWCGNGHMDERLEKAKRYPTNETAERSSKHIKLNKGQWRRSSVSLETLFLRQKVKVA